MLLLIGRSASLREEDSRQRTFHPSRFEKIFSFSFFSTHSLTSLTLNPSSAFRNGLRFESFAVPFGQKLLRYWVLNLKEEREKEGEKENKVNSERWWCAGKQIMAISAIK